jgi:hypothetical protein
LTALVYEISIFVVPFLTKEGSGLMKTPMLNWEADSCYYQRGGTLRVDAASFFLGRINLAWVVPNSFQPQKGKSIETTAPLAKL